MNYISKSAILINVCLSALILTSSCTSEEETDYMPSSGITLELSVTPTSATVDARDASLTIYVTSNTTWGVSCDESWCELPTTSGKGTQSLKLTFDDNTDSETRTVWVDISTSQSSWNVSITQNGGTIPVVSAPSVTDVGRYGATVVGAYTSQFDVTEYGAVYSTTSSTPTLDADNVVSLSGGTTSGTIAVELSDLTAGSTYYVRLYATSAIGIAYGSVATFQTAGSVPSMNDNPTPSY